MADEQWKKNIGPHQFKPGGKNGDPVKSAATRRRQKAMRNAAQQLLWHSLKDVPDESDVVRMLGEMGVDDPTGADAIMLAQYVKARRGDTEAARFIRDTAGEKPSSTMEINHLLDKPIDEIDFSRLSDAELEQLVHERNMTLIPGAVVETDIAEPEPVPVRAEPEPVRAGLPPTAPSAVRRGVRNPEGNYPWGGVEMNMNLNKPEKHKSGPAKKTLQQKLQEELEDRLNPEAAAAREEAKRIWAEERAARKAAAAAAKKEENDNGSDAG